MGENEINGKAWHVYMVQCSDNSIYTGITTDIVRRVFEHNGKKKGAKYTRTRQPVKLVYSENHGDRSSASKRESVIKKLIRKEKLLLIENKNQTHGKM